VRRCPGPSRPGRQGFPPPISSNHGGVAPAPPAQPQDPTSSPHLPRRTTGRWSRPAGTAAGSLPPLLSSLVEPPGLRPRPAGNHNGSTYLSFPSSSHEAWAPARRHGHSGSGISSLPWSSQGLCPGPASPAKGSPSPHFPRRSHGRVAPRRQRTGPPPFLASLVEDHRGARLRGADRATGSHTRTWLSAVPSSGWNEKSP
jgi:hypothetical protein